MKMSEENRAKARARMLAYHASKKATPIVETPAEVPLNEVEQLKARIAELEKPVEKNTEIRNAYQRGRNSIQDIARIYGKTVDEVLFIIGESRLSSVSFSGDMIDEQEAGDEVPMNYGKTIKVPFTTD